MENERKEEERRRKKMEEERRRKKKEEEKKKKIQVWNCDALNPRVSLITRQPMKFLWISDDPIPYCCVPFIGIHIFTKIGQSFLCSGSSTQHTTCMTV